ncbi:MAG: hypothetical protein ACE5HE_06320 [Phycisphaerae bacterium]
MSFASPSISTTDELSLINAELARLLHSEPAELRIGADHALGDELVMCGILGGKDVGKSTLINALARTRVSPDTREVGRGTERPKAYVHERMRSEVAHRLDAIDRSYTVEVTTHKADAIQNVVLIDLPDFDSEFSDHHSIVRAVVPLLDRVLWVQTPRKIGDRAWVDMLPEVIKDARNVHSVLNKVDQLLADEAPGDDRNGPRAAAVRSAVDRAQRFWREQHEWAARSIEAAGYAGNDERLFLVAAAFPRQEQFIERIAWLWGDTDWSRYPSDRAVITEIARLASDDLARLRGCVLTPVSPEQSRRIKYANQEREHRVSIDTMLQHYDLDRTAELLAHACDPQYLRAALADDAGVQYSAIVAANLLTHLRSDRALADELFERRVEDWPLLRLVYWPFGWLSRVLGRRVALERQGLQTTYTGDPFLVGGRTLADRIELARSQLLCENVVIIDRLDLESELPQAAELAGRAAAGAEPLVAEVETRLLDEVEQCERRPSFLSKMLLWLILLWFPIVQPVLEGGLEVYLKEGALDVAHGLYKVVSALSAAHLLVGLAVVTAVYIALLAGMYARRLRAVRRMRAQRDAVALLAEGVDDLLACEVAAPLARPFQERLDRLDALRRRLNDTQNAPDQLAGIVDQ